MHNASDSVSHQNLLLLEQVFEHSPEIVFVISTKNLRVLYANPAAQNALGFSLHELTDLTLPKLTNSFSEDVLNAALVKGNVKHFCCAKLARKNNGTIKINTHLNCLRAGETYFVIQGETIDYQNAQNETDKYHSTLFNNIFDAIVATDEDLIITSYNQHAGNIFGWKEDEAIGNSSKLLANTIYPGFTTEQIVEIIKTKGKWKGEVLTHRKSGEQFPAIYSISAVTGDDGNIKGIITVIRDITEQKKLESQLRRSNEELEERVKEKTKEITNIFERITDAFISYDKDWNYNYINAKAGELIGVSPAKLIGKNIWSEFPAFKNFSFYADYHKAMDEQLSFHTEDYYPDQKKWFHSVYYPSPQGLSVFFHDITEKKNAEIKLEDSEAKYRTIVETAQEGFWQIDENSNTTFVNNYLAELLEYSTADMLGKNMFDYVGKENLEFVAKNIDERRKGKSTQFELTFKSKTGKEIYTLIQSKPLFKNGEYKGSFATILDITDRKNDEAKLAAGEKRLKVLFENSFDGIFFLSSTAIILDASPSVEQILGYPKDEVLNKSCKDFVLPSHLAQIEKAIKEVIEHPEKIIKSQYEAYKKDGSVIWIECTYRNLIENEDVNAVVANFSDINERKNAKNQLLLSEKNYRLLFSENPVALWMFDKETLNILEVNQAAINQYGYTREEFLHLNLKDFKTLEDHAYLNTLFQSETHHFFEGVVTHLKKNGERLYVKVNANKIIYNNQIVFLAALRNITKELLQKKKLKESQQQLSLIFETTKDIIWLLKVVGPDKYELETCNKAYTKIVGKPRKEIIGKTLEEIHFDINLKRIKLKYNKAILTKQPVTFLMTATVAKKEVILEMNIIPITNEEGTVVKLLGNANDVTEKNKSRRDLIKLNLELRELTSHLQNIREEERTHIAREIHDELGQQLTVLKMDLAWLSKKITPDDSAINNKLKLALELVDQTINSVRKISAELRPGIIDDLGINFAIEWHCQEFTKHSGIIVDYTSNLSDKNLRQNISNALYRIVQEALTNVLRHANASKVICTLNQIDNEIVLMVNDNGVGFAGIEKIEKQTLGLLGMRERTGILNGKFNLETKTGQGTTLTVSIPVSMG